MQVWIGVGRLGRDPEAIETSSGTKMVKFSMAVDDYNSRDGDDPMWLNVIAFKRLADVALDYLHKGAKVCIQGRLSVNEWVGDDGNKRRNYEIIANTIDFMSERRDGNSERGTSPPPNRQAEPREDLWQADEDEDPFGDQ